MSPTAKDLEANSSQTTARTSSTEEANKPQPVPLEVPVTVNGARTVEGSDKREPFSETTQTVLVMHNGAVIRLSSTVTAGQLLFLTNDKTKKEVVCQVVKSKNYRNVSGYVELEFTEAVAGFWGMRFPGERTAPSAPVAAAPARPAATTPVSTIAPAAPKVEAPAPTNVAPRVEPQPVAPRPAAPVAPVFPAANLPRHAAPPIASAPSAPIFAARPETPNAPSPNSKPTSSLPLPKSPGLTDGWGSGMTSSAPIAIQPPAPSAPKASVSNVVPAPPTPQVSARVQATTPDVLRRQSEKLQEQLATMLLCDEAKSVPAAPVSKVVEIPRQQNQAAKPVPPLKSAPLPSADQDEVKIPSWLEPLARNAAMQSQNELIAKEETHDDRVLEFEVQDLSVPATAKEDLRAEDADPVLETYLTDSPTDLAAHAPKKGNKAILIGAIAAGLVLVAAGATWYSRNSSGASSQASSTTAEAATAPAAVAPEESAAIANASQPAVRTADKAATPNRSNLNSEPVPAKQPAASQQNAPTAQLAKAVDRNTSAELSAYKKLAEPAPVVKKPSLGEVHLAAPNAARSAGEVVGEAEALALNSSGQIVPAGDAMGGGLVAGNAKQPVAPAAPLPIGGDVKAARLISSVAPVYPSLARAQHIQGQVLVDALVDVNGRVSSMKVVSGPVLLHQAAMDALHQWKYQAAMLDGKPVPMHLTVTVQFRLQ
ncbi:MAG: TonB family protein [Acidobacteria bacterium]|nr:TonB family protein [Acidobacteriota bacterium]